MRACACLIAFLVRVIKRTFERDGNLAERERERERGLDGKIFSFFLSLLSCLVLSSFFFEPSSDECEGKEKRRIITPKI